MKSIDTFIENLQFSKQVGVGAFSKVHLAISSEEGLHYAIKSIARSKEGLEIIQKEMKAGKLLKNKNIVNFICSFERDDDHHLVFDFVKGVELFSFLEQRDFKPLDEDECRTIFRQLVDAVHECHQKGVVHRDLKLDNIMYDPETNHVTLIDFGLCEFITEENGGYFIDRVGCMEYCAPELLTEDEIAYEAIKMDIWCLGCILYALLNGAFPFDLDQRKSLIQNGQPHPHPTFAVDLSDEVRDLIHGLLKVSPETRLTLEEVKSHPWFL